MATFHSRFGGRAAAAAAALLWATAAAGQAAPESVAVVRARLAEDSGNAHNWLELGRAYIRLSAGYHEHHPAPAASPDDTAWVRAVLDSADRALERAAELAAGTRQGDSARMYRVFIRGERTVLAWEQGGIPGATETWANLPPTMRLAPVLEELGENLLRACPRQGVLLTANEIDTYAAWYLRFARGLRPDLLIVPLALWRTDSVFRRRVVADARPMRPRASGRSADGSLRDFAERGPLCASLGFERAPATQPRTQWSGRPLVWVAGRTGRDDRVHPRDFVFAALRLALDENDPWARRAIEVYRRAAAQTRALCESFAVYQLTVEVGCR